MKKLKYAFAVLFALLICLAAMYISARESEKYPQPCQGVPAVWDAEGAPEDHGIHQIAEDGTFLYILSDEHNGVVQVYDLEGNYRHTLAFYAHLNGAFRIAAETDTLYVRDMRQNLYIFRDGQFEEFLNRRDAAAALEGLDFDGDHPDYEIRDGSVWRVENGEETCVLHRPKSAAAYRRNVTLVSGVIVFALLGIAGLIQRGRKR